MEQPPSFTKAATHVTNQDCTSYYKGTTTASGKSVKIGYVAVNYLDSALNPVLPFGTVIIIDKVTDKDGNSLTYVPTLDGNLSIFTVEDTGNGFGKGLSYYWLDFYLKGAIECENFGKRTVAYWY
ncbi:3D (Asp-Asp-Asp) domain-containing protein [Anaerotaenia torta]|uniref:hypothetical protein n=1 Tax=Anaerotaenia torta TaxID=433293 RepID=UPI003D1A5CEB